MNNFYSLDFIIVLLLSSIVISVLCSWISIKIAPKVGLMDIPGSAKHKSHHKAVPLTGGIVLLDTLLFIIFFTGLWRDEDILAMLLAGLVIGIMGILDDLINLNPVVKLLGQILASLILIRLGIMVDLFNSPDFFFRTETQIDNYLNLILTIIWLTTVTNAFNFIDSSDGLAVGLSGVSSAFFILISLNTNQNTILFISTIILGVCIGLYFFNSHPASLFLGDSGAQTLGFLLASIAILYKPESGTQLSTWFVPIMIFFVPLFDLILVIISRFKRNKEIYKASQDHTYHRLSKRGIPIHHSVLMMHGVSLVLSMIGYLCLNLPANYSNIIFMLSVLLGILAFIELDRDYN
jgi:UDP-GlcNAc:undecaprenyl-phosphate/decaprenyl-phosphate GlcNAc-1-phosphate transferase